MTKIQCRVIWNKLEKTRTPCFGLLSIEYNLCGVRQVQLKLTTRVNAKVTRAK